MKNYSRRQMVFDAAALGVSIAAVVCSIAGVASAELNSPATFRCFGTIVDDQNHPQPGAKLEYYRMSGELPAKSEDLVPDKIVTADGQGHFEFPAPKSPALLVARPSGLAPAWMIIAEPREKEWRVVAHPSGTFSGVVLDSDRRPVADAEVWTAWVLDSKQAQEGRYWEGILSSPAARKYFSTRSRADGRFQIDGFPKDAVGLLAARKSGLASPPTSSSSEQWYQGGVCVSVGQQDVKIVLEPTGSIEGRIATDDDRPVGGVALCLKPKSETWSEAMVTTSTAGDGSFYFPDVAAGTYLLRGAPRASQPGGGVVVGAQYYVRPGEKLTNHTSRIVPGAILVVTVRSKDNGRPIPGVALTLDEESYVTDNDGSHTFRVPVGGCSMFMQKQWFQETSASTNVIAGQTNHLEVALVPWPKITGRVLLPSGKPAGGAEVTGFLGGRTNPGLRTESTADGRFDFPGHDNWDQLIQTASGVIVRDPINNLAAFVPLVVSNRQLIVNLAPGVSVAGRVEDSAGHSLSNVKVTVGSSDRELPFTESIERVTTDLDGRFEVAGLPAGYGYRISAIMAEAHEGGEALVPAGKTNRVEVAPIVLNVRPQRHMILPNPNP